MITDSQILAVQSGSQTFDAFVRANRSDFTAMATRMAARWGRLPASLELDDIIQAMLIGAYKAIASCDPGTGSPAQHVVFLAHAAASRELRRARQLDKRAERADAPDLQAATQDAFVLARERVDMLPQSDRQRAILRSLVRTFSLDATTAELLSDPATRALFADNPNNARRSVYRAAQKLRDRATVA